MTQDVLEAENALYRGTAAISRNCRQGGYVPGFRDEETGRIYRSCTASGCPSPVHLLDGLPEHLILDRGRDGHVTAVKPCVVSGFIHDGCFYTREQLAPLRK